MSAEDWNPEKWGTLQYERAIIQKKIKYSWFSVPYYALFIDVRLSEKQLILVDEFNAYDEWLTPNIQIMHLIEGPGRPPRQTGRTFTYTYNYEFLLEEAYIDALHYVESFRMKLYKWLRGRYIQLKNAEPAQIQAIPTAPPLDPDEMADRVTRRGRDEC